MTAVRLRGQDAITRALEVRTRHLEGMETIQELADHYQASTEAIRQWLKLARQHTLPPLEDREAWLTRIVTNVAVRLEDAKDADAVKIGEALTKWLGIGSAQELKQHMAALETAKVALVAKAFDDAVAGQPNRAELRQAFLTAVAAHESG